MAISREQGEFSPATTPPHTHHRDTTTPTGTQPSPVGPRQRAPPGARASTRYKTLPATPTTGPNRYKTLPATPTSRPNRYKTLPARPESTKSGHFSRAGRIFSRSQHCATEQGEFFPATTPLHTHHRDTTTPTGTKLSRHAHNQRNPAISHEQGEFSPGPNTAPPSRENFLPQQHHPTPITGTPPPQPVQNSPGTPTINEIRPFLTSRENLFPVPPPRHRAGRIFSRNNTTPHPSQGHHHPNRYTTLPSRPPTTRSARGTSQHTVQNSPSNSRPRAQPVQNSPSTPTTGPNRYKTLPARPKTPKSGHFSRARRIFSRSQRRVTEQGEFFPVPNAASPSRENFLPLPTPIHHSPGTKLSRQQPPPDPTGTKLSQHAHNQRNPAISREQGEFFPASTTTPPSRENFLPLPTPTTGTNRYKTLPAPPPPGPTGTKLSPQHPPPDPTGTKLSRRQPPQGTTGTKLSQHPPPPGPTGTKLSRHAQKQRNPAISREQGEFFPASTTTPPSRENFLPLPTPTGTKLSRHAQKQRNTAISHEQGEFFPASTTTPPSRENFLPQQHQSTAQPVQNSPGTPKNTEILPFLTSKENFFPFPTPRHRAGRIFSRNNTTLVSISTQLTDWSPLSPEHQTNAPLAGHCAGYWLLILM